MTHRPLFEACVDAAPALEAAFRRVANGVAPGDASAPFARSALFDWRETRAEIVVELIAVLAGLAPATAPSSSGGARPVYSPAYSIGTSR